MSARRGEPLPRAARKPRDGEPEHHRREDPGRSAAPGVPLFLRSLAPDAAAAGEAGTAAAPTFTAAGLSIQRAPADGAASPAPAPASPSPGPEPPGAGPAADARTPVPGLIVDDAAVDLAPGQMRKADFLALLRGEVCGAAEQALAGTLWSAVGCPYIDRWFGHYAGQSAEHVERALRRYVPEAAGASTAAGYVPLVAARVRSAIAEWSADGGAPPEAEGGEAASGGGLLSTVAGFFFKARDGGARAESSPLSVRAKLGRGSALDGGVGARMGAALGRDFSRVRVHTDSRAGSLSEGMNARAFTVGDHVAFAPGEYRPGTPVGDALIAHELAHVAQQQGGGPAAAPAAGPDGAYEEEADRAAVGAVGRIWGGMASIGAGALPALRSGLRLQRCSRRPAPAPDLLAAFEAQFPAPARLIRASESAMRLVREAQAAGAAFGGAAEDGPGRRAWPYTVGNTVYVPRGRDTVQQMTDFLFELNNAIRAPAMAAIDARGSARSITAREYARQVVEQEVEGMLRLGEIWFTMRNTDPSWSRYDAENYQTEYNDFRAGRKTKDQIIDDVLHRVRHHAPDPGITIEQYYINQYNRMHP